MALVLSFNMPGTGSREARALCLMAYFVRDESERLSLLIRSNRRLVGLSKCSNLNLRSPMALVLSFNMPGTGSREARALCFMAYFVRDEGERLSLLIRSNRRLVGLSKCSNLNLRSPMALVLSFNMPGTGSRETRALCLMAYFVRDEGERLSLLIRSNRRLVGLSKCSNLNLRSPMALVLSFNMPGTGSREARALCLMAYFVRDEGERLSLLIRSNRRLVRLSKCSNLNLRSPMALVLSFNMPGTGSREARALCLMAYFVRDEGERISLLIRSNRRLVGLSKRSNLNLRSPMALVLSFNMPGTGSREARALCLMAYLVRDESECLSLLIRSNRRLVGLSKCSNLNLRSPMALVLSFDMPGTGSREARALCLMAYFVRDEGERLSLLIKSNRRLVSLSKCSNLAQWPLCLASICLEQGAGKQGLYA